MLKFLPYLQSLHSKNTVNPLPYFRSSAIHCLIILFDLWGLFRRFECKWCVERCVMSRFISCNPKIRKELSSMTWIYFFRFPFKIVNEIGHRRMLCERHFSWSHDFWSRLFPLFSFQTSLVPKLIISIFSSRKRQIILLDTVAKANQHSGKVVQMTLTWFIKCDRTFYRICRSLVEWYKKRVIKLSRITNKQCNFAALVSKWWSDNLTFDVLSNARSFTSSFPYEGGVEDC